MVTNLHKIRADLLESQASCTQSSYGGSHKLSGLNLHPIIKDGLEKEKKRQNK